MCDKTLVLAEFNEGYSFRQMVEFLNSSLEDAVFHFTKNKIFVHRTNSTDSIYIKLDIDAESIGNYEYNTNEPEIKFGIDFSKLKTLTSNLSKSDRIRLYIMPNDPENLIYQRIDNTGPQNKTSIRNKKIDKDDEVEVADYEQRPNCTVLPTDLTDMHKNFNTMKCKNVSMVGFPQGVLFESKTGSEIMRSQRLFGNCLLNFDEKPFFNPNSSLQNKLDMEINDALQLIKIDIPIGTLKSLSKKNFGSNYPISLFFKENESVKLVARLGKITQFGSITTYIAVQ